MKNIRFLILGSFVCLSLGACQNTVDGFGQDMEKAGKKIQGERVQNNNATATPTGTTYSTNNRTYDSGKTYSTSPTYGDVY